jgi:Tol biopolymer transport system component
MKNRRSYVLKKASYVLGALLIGAALSMGVVSCAYFQSNNYPSWSPDGTRIVYSHKSEIWVVNADGTDPKKLLDNGQFAAWSPDGTRIAFISKNNAIWLMNTDNSSKRELIHDAGAQTLTWSPDSTKIAFSSPSSSIVTPPGIWIINVDGSNQKRLTSNPQDFWPAWSPDGTKIAFYSNSGRKTNIWIMNADGSDRKSLTEPNADYCPAWSPDGKITFQHNGSFWVMNADGSNQRILVPMTANIASLAWSRDGTRIAFVAGVGEGNDIFVMDADGTKQTKLIK